jgi:predicted nucleic acid-binding protein
VHPSPDVLQLFGAAAGPQPKDPKEIQKARAQRGDAVLAAQAAASGGPVATFDRDFGRFPDVRCHQWV